MPIDKPSINQTIAEIEADAKYAREHDRPIDLPKFFMVQIRMRCDCPAAEILTESIMLPWDAQPDHVAYMVAQAVRHAKLEAADHLVKRKNQ